MAHELPPLPYAYNALEPHIDEQTMRIHHDKHHAAYVANLNKALDSAPDLASSSLDELLKNIGGVPESIRQAVINNGGGYILHSDHSEPPEVNYETMKFFVERGRKIGTPKRKA